MHGFLWLKTITMQIDDFDFELPDNLIARFPSETRSGSRLLHVKQDQCIDRQFSDILDQFSKDDLLIFNQTKVMAARVYGQKSSGGKVELLLERLLENNQALAHIKSSRAPKEDAVLTLDGNVQCTVIGRQENLFLLAFDSELNMADWLENHGHMPLPPYMDREDELSDRDRYQTVYAKELGAVAAPTAGLHFDDNIMNAIKQKGIECAYVTLHVGAGTFAPVKVDNINDHVMHSEWLNVSQEVCDAIHQCKARGGKVIAVGTTTVRSLETAAQKSTTDEIAPFTGDSNIFIYPGYTFKAVDKMITNFHLPKSTLLMLVSAFAGTDVMMSAYQTAIERQYRFYSYGDSMLIEPK